MDASIIINGRLFYGESTPDYKMSFRVPRTNGDWAAFVRNSALVRKAFVMWMAMVMADGVLADVEQRAIRELQSFVNSFSLIDDSFLLAAKGELLQLAKFDRALKQAKDLQTDRRLHEQIEKSQIRLAAMVQG